MLPDLLNLQWIKCVALFKANLNNESLNKTTPLCVMEAITKAISDRTWGIPKNDWANRPIFHFNGRPHNFKPSPAETYEVEFIFTDKTDDEIAEWLKNFELYFSEPENCRTFYPVDISSTEKRNIEDIINEAGEIPDSGEICLRFLTPYHFKPGPGKTRYYIDARIFLKSVINRINRLFNQNFPAELNPEFETLPYYWEYTEIKHLSHSQPGHHQFINGCIGPLYLRGNFVSAKPWLYLASELHAGSKMANSLGYFILIPESQPYFDLRFPRLNEIKEITREVVERYDEALLQLIQPGLEKPGLDEIAEQLYRQLSDGSYSPLPYKAFTIKSESGKERQVEQPEYRDIIAGLYALRLLSPALDKAFEEESIGFRKGRSREKAIELVRQAINNGYLWLVESDIENYFPSINLDKLQALLDKFLPEKDIKFRKFISSLIHAPYRLGEAVMERRQGVAQGHPLSPCLANLYLDSFDEKIKSKDVRLIRYGDDFLVFCRTREQAESVVQEIENILSGLDLKIKPDKTAIKNVSEGFQFLGYNFSGTEADIFQPPEIKLLKKPLFITEPYTLVTVDGQSVSIKKQGQVLQSVPLRRISEILVMEKAVISTSLIARCLQNKIPLTVALNSGYFLTTVRPDSKDYYIISSKHVAKYFSLSGAELISLAREVALSKIDGYLYLFNQRYSGEVKSVVKKLRSIARQLEVSADLNEIRGLEGLASRQVYAGFNLIITNTAFHLEKRLRKPPDRINSLLNFGSYLLYSRINALVRSAGLNPYLGFLHSPADDYESLVSDIVDIFRPQMERLIIKLINLKIIDEKDFEPSDQGFYLNKDGKHRFLSYFENELNQKKDAEKLSLKERMTLQVKIIKDWVIKDGSLVFLRWSK